MLCGLYTLSIKYSYGEILFSVKYIKDIFRITVFQYLQYKILSILCDHNQRKRALIDKIANPDNNLNATGMQTDYDQRRQVSTSRTG